MFLIDCIVYSFISMFKRFKKAFREPIKKVKSIKSTIKSKTTQMALEVKSWTYEMYSRWHIDSWDSPTNYRFTL